VIITVMAIQLMATMTFLMLMMPTISMCICNMIATMMITPMYGGSVRIYALDSFSRTFKKAVTNVA